MKAKKTGKLAEEADRETDLDNSSKERVKKHYSDINDKITDEDIKNANVPESKPSRKKKEIQKDVEENKEETPRTSWNILEG